jgi:hypothetical protein
MACRSSWTRTIRSDAFTFVTDGRLDILGAPRGDGLRATGPRGAHGPRSVEVDVASLDGLIIMKRASGRVGRAHLEIRRRFETRSLAGPGVRRPAKASNAGTTAMSSTRRYAWGPVVTMTASRRRAELLLKPSQVLRVASRQVLASGPRWPRFAGHAPTIGSTSCSRLWSGGGTGAPRWWA